MSSLVAQVLLYVFTCVLAQLYETTDAQKRNHLGTDCRKIYIRGLPVLFSRIITLNSDATSNYKHVPQHRNPVPTVLSTSFRKSSFFFFFFFFVWRITQKKKICKFLSCFNTKQFVVTTDAQKVLF